MKKLRLGKLKLLAEEVLQRNQLATVYGGSDVTFIMCDCNVNGQTKIATCTQDLVNQGGNRCCEASYGSGAIQSNC